jgi:ankyrin repeat protein
LIDSGVDVNQAEGNEGRTALMQAVWLGNLKNIKLLIDSGADVNAKDKHGRTALMEAAYWGYVDAVNMLIEAGADIDAKSDLEMTALDFATRKTAEVLRSSAR